MFAIVKTGGKQYRIEKGSVLSVEKLNAKEGDKVTLENILFLGDGKTAKVGSPLVNGAKVTAEVIAQYKDEKVIVFKKKRRQNYRRKKGHRQNLTQIKVTDIKG